MYKKRIIQNCALTTVSVLPRPPQGAASTREDRVAAWQPIAAMLPIAAKNTSKSEEADRAAAQDRAAVRSDAC
jgi:hypothetical protein